MMKIPGAAFRLLLPPIGLFGLAVCLQAQTGPGLPGFSCTTSVTVAPTLRSEGITELFGDILLQCSGGTPTPKGQPVPVANITVRLNTAVTNGYTIPGNPSVDAYLLIDDPQPSSQKVAQTTASSMASPDGNQLGVDGGLNFQNGSIPNIFRATISNVNSVTWFGVPIDPKTGDRVFRIVNVRANAAALYAGRTDANTPVIASISMFAGTSQIPITNPTPTVAFVQAGLRTALTTNSAVGCSGFNTTITPLTPPNPEGSNYSLLTFSSGAPGAFKPQLTVNGPSVPGATPVSEAGFIPPGVFPVKVSGTRLKAHFSNIPDGVHLFVENGNNFQAASGFLFSPTPAPGSPGLTEVAVVNGTGTAVWEVLTSNPNTNEAVKFGVWTSFAGSPAKPVPPTQLTVNTSFAPVANAYPAWGNLAIPRFTDPYSSSPESITEPSAHSMIFFNVLSCSAGSPQLSNLVLDKRGCYPGAAIGPADNACSAGEQPRLNILSDNAAVAPSIRVNPDKGVTLIPQLTTGGAVGGNTPLAAIVFVNATNAPPGTYTPSLTVTAQGATNTLTIPYTVTVPGPNTPIITPQGLDDAATYIGSFVHPGQIFTGFGNAFTDSATLAVASLDGDGKLPNVLAGGQITFDGTKAPELYFGANQMGGVVPFNVTGKSSVKVQLTYNGNSSPVITVPVTPASIAILSANASGGGGGAIFNADGTLNSPSNPATAGTPVTIYATYSGPMSVPGTDGRTTTGAPYPAPQGPFSVTFGDVPATNIAYFGNSPTLLESVIQVNTNIPVNVKQGSYVPVVIGAGGVTSPPWITVAVKLP